MKVRVKFDSHTSKLILSGYEKKHGKQEQDAVASVDYIEIPEYIKLGKQVRRKEAVSSFIEHWGAVLFWVVVIGGFIGLATYNNIESQATNNESSGRYSNPSKSGIYEAESCPITTCNDGACSTSTGRGTCSHHGGIAY